MAPKRRKKTGLTRMDAALDQMTSFGFSRKLVRKTVGKLLKVYGDDGWKFIEEDGYKVLLDVILEEQETTQTHTLLEDASLTYNAEPSEVPLLSIEGPGNQECLKDADVDKNNLHDTDDDHSANKVGLQNSENTLPSGCSSVRTPVNIPARTRKPCYGWISDDDSDNDTKFLELTPAT